RFLLMRPQLPLKTPNFMTSSSAMRLLSNSVWRSAHTNYSQRRNARRAFSTTALTQLCCSAAGASSRKAIPPSVRFLATPPTMLVESMQAELLQEALQQVVSERQPIRIELTAHRKDGKVFTADMALSPMQESDADNPRIICSIRDISPRKQLEHELRSALE